MEKVICIIGCDAETYISEEDWGAPFTKEEEATIKKICVLSKKKSEYQCMPIVTLEEKGEEWEKR